MIETDITLEVEKENSVDNKIEDPESQILQLKEKEPSFKR